MTSYSQRTPKFLKIRYLQNYAIKMHRVNFQKFFSNDLFHKINYDSDFIAPLSYNEVPFHETANLGI